MLRNLYSKNSLPYRPTARFTKNTGPGESHLINTAIKSANGSKSTSMIRPRAISRERFATSYNVRLRSVTTSGTLRTGSAERSALEEILDGTADMFKLLLRHLWKNGQ